MSSRADIDWKRVVTLFMRAGLANAAAASVFTAPLLIPSLAFPILLTQWGAIYMVLGYLSFIFYGVVGIFCWAAAYYILATVQGRLGYDRVLSYLQLATHMVSAYGASTTLFTGGYIGARLVYEGRPVQAVGAVMEVVEIPAGLFIMLAIASTITGLLNVIKKG